HHSNRGPAAEGRPYSTFNIALHTVDAGHWRGCVVVPQAIQELRVWWTIGDHVPISQHKLLAWIDLEAAHLRWRVVEVRIVGMDSQWHGSSEIGRMIQHSEPDQLAIVRSADVTPATTSRIAVCTRL